MYLMCRIKPVYRESHVVATADKIYEFARFNLFTFLKTAGRFY